MSMAIKVAKSQYRGDPGLFSFLGKAAGGLVKAVGGAVGGFISGGPAGAILGAARTVIPSAKPSVFVAQSPSAGTVMTAGSMAGLPALPGIGLPGGVGKTGVSLVPFGQGGLVQPMGVAPGGATGPLVGTNGAGAACQRGYHFNRTGYFTKKYGYIEKGTVCIKNRRRNPLNPRALSRAMSRLESAKNASKALSRITIRDRGCGCGRK